MNRFLRKIFRKIDPTLRIKYQLRMADRMLELRFRRDRE